AGAGDPDPAGRRRRRAHEQRVRQAAGRRPGASLARLERGEKQGRSDGDRRRPRQPEEHPPERRSAVPPLTDIAEREQREEEKHRFGVHRAEKERDGKEKQEDESPPRADLASPRERLPEEKREREEEANVGDEHPRM